MEALATTPPEGSVTVPASVERSRCANDAQARKKVKNAIRTDLCIHNPCLPAKRGQIKALSSQIPPKTSTEKALMAIYGTASWRFMYSGSLVARPKLRC